MSRKLARNSRSSRPSTPTVRRMKLFRPTSWRKGTIAHPPDEYIVHLLTELGRLGLEVPGIERYDRPPNTNTVLSDLLSFRTRHPGDAYSRLTDWTRLDLEVMQSRLQENAEAKPRIELSANITRTNNLSVRWHPGGWSESESDWSRGYSSNLIARRRWRERPDFRQFTGDEEPHFNRRPTNELMYIRGVGNLETEPRSDYGPYATFNRDVVDSILVCAVRSAYESLIEQLKHSFAVTVMDGFDFVTREEMVDIDPFSHRTATRRVVSWSLENASPSVRSG